MNVDTRSVVFLPSLSNSLVSYVFQVQPEDPADDTDDVWYVYEVRCATCHLFVSTSEFKYVRCISSFSHFLTYRLLYSPYIRQMIKDTLQISR